MRFLFAGWFSATAGRHYSAKLRCGKREALFWQAKNRPRSRSRPRPRKTQPSLDYEDDDEDEATLRRIANAAFIRHTVRPDEQTVLHHHRD
jgi:hypothetical protein